MDAVVDVGVIDNDEMLLGNVNDLWLAGDEVSVRIGATARTVSEYLALGRTSPPIVLLDVLLHDGTTPTENVLRLVREGHTVVAISALYDAGRIREVVRAGVHSYVPKTQNSAELVSAIWAAAEGRPFTSRDQAGAMDADGQGAVRLSTQEREALRLYASGMTIPKTAERMGVATSTVKGYIDRVRDKYSSQGREAHTKIDLRQRAGEDGVLAEAAILIMSKATRASAL